MKHPYHLLKEGFESLIMQNFHLCPRNASTVPEGFKERCSRECYKLHCFPKEEFDDKAIQCWVDHYVALAKQGRYLRLHYLKKGQLDLTKG